MPMQINITVKLINFVEEQSGLDFIHLNNMFRYMRSDQKRDKKLWNNIINKEDHHHKTL